MYEINPFGNPDGAQASTNKLVNDFIDYVPKGVINGANSINDFTQLRLIVGHKGSGKTHYLRMLRETIKSKSSESSYITDIDNMKPDTAEVIEMCRYMSSISVKEKWEGFWKKVVYISLITHYLYSEDLKEYCNKQKEDFENFIKDIFHECKSPYSIIEVFHDLICNFSSKQEFDNFMNDTIWIEVYHMLKDIMRTSPELYFFLDSMDEYYEQAPQYWTTCHAGLFNVIIHFLREGIIREKLHLIACFRTNIYNVIRSDEHQVKTQKENHILNLEWDYNNIKYFFDRKIQALKECYFLKWSDSGKTIETWLGINEIYDKKENKTYSLMDYIIRKGRMVPRDIIAFGNNLATVKQRSLENPHVDLLSLISSSIEETAYLIGNELLKISVKQMMIYNVGNVRDTNYFMEGYSSDRDVWTNQENDLLSYFNKLGKNWFTKNDIPGILEFSKALFDSNQLLNVLWQNRVIGYIEEDTIIYFGIRNRNDLIFPKNEEVFYFNPCVYNNFKFKEYRRQNNVNN